MKKYILAALFFSSAAFANEIIIDNQTSYPNKNEKMAIQWASSAQEVDQKNKALMHDPSVRPSSLQPLKEKGKIELAIPKNTSYFRVVAWSKTGQGLEFSTNWIEIVSGKEYTLKTEHLTPIVLMPGMGC